MTEEVIKEIRSQISYLQRARELLRPVELTTPFYNIGFVKQLSGYLEGGVEVLEQRLDSATQAISENSKTK